VFATMRRKSRNRRMKNELGQSVDHFKRAATLAAQETSATVGPKLNAAVDRVQPAAVKAKDAASSGWGSAVATITPLVTAATDNVRQTGKVSKRQARKTAKVNQKPLRSQKSRTTDGSPAHSARSAPVSRTSSSARLGRPVSWSWVAWWISRRSACWRCRASRPTRIITSGMISRLPMVSSGPSAGAPSSCRTPATRGTASRAAPRKSRRPTLSRSAGAAPGVMSSSIDGESTARPTQR
jgi:hypothetical protein